MTTPSSAFRLERLRWGALWAVAALIVPLLAGVEPPGDHPEAIKVAVVTALMAVMWVGVIVPLWITALLPLALFPLLGIHSFSATLEPYSSPLIMLFFGGFILALAMFRCGLSLRLSLVIVRLADERPGAIIFGCMATTAFLSMWVSNTASTMVMLPMALAVIALLRHTVRPAKMANIDGESSFATALLLGIAYSASIGGMGTLVGTPPNAILAGFLRESFSYEIGFFEWMTFGIPLVAVLLVAAWFWLTRILFRFDPAPIKGTNAMIDQQLAELGPMSHFEKWIAAIATLTALAWITRPLLNRIANDAIPGWTVSDANIAVAAATVVVAVFIVKSSFFEHTSGILEKTSSFTLHPLNNHWLESKIPRPVLMRLDNVSFLFANLDWRVLTLIGGGLALSMAIKQSGLGAWLIGGGSGYFELAAIPGIPLVFSMMVILLLTTLAMTELASNSATAAVFVPIVALLAIGLGENPLVLAIPAALISSCAFMLPVATPPNAIVYGSGRITTGQMARAGIRLDLTAVTVIALLVTALLSMMLGVEQGVVPDWAQR